MRHLATALAICSLPIVSVAADAAEPVPEGSTATITVRLTVRDQVKSDFHSSVMEHIFDGQCVMRASAVSQVGMDGMTPEQEAAAIAANAKGAAVAQEFGHSDDMLAAIEAGAEKCGDDEACIMALAMQLSQTPEMQAMAKQAPEAQAAIAGLVPDMGPQRYQIWQPENCSGTVTINDTYIDSDPGGEGGDGAYTDTTTVQGSVPLRSDWRFMVMQTDTVDNATIYQVVAPPPVTVDANSSRSGAHKREIPFLAGTELPDRLGPYPGVLSSNRGEVESPSGSITAEWSAQK